MIPSGAQVLIVNSNSPGRVAGVISTPQPTVLKRPVRSSRLRKEVETIALDDDDEPCGVSASSSSGGGDCGENGNGNSGDGEPSEKKARLEDSIRDEVLLVFPPGESGAVSLHFEDLRVLAHGEMLNDNIIEFYLKYIRAKLLPEEQRDKVFVFNTFFYQKLTEKQPSISILNKNHRSSVGRFEWIKRNFSKVKSWTKRVDIFKMDYIVLPINDEMHWYLVIIVKPALAVVPQRTEDVDVARKRGSFRENPDTFIVVLDSLPDPNDVKRKCVLDILRDYLECELADKRGSQQELYLDRTRIGALYPVGVPHQENYVDCGLYLLQFAEAFLTKPPVGKMLRQGVRWKDWYPWFDQTMFFMREKISGRLKGLCSRRAWQRLETYERQQGRGVSIETTSLMIDRKLMLVFVM
ncbi:Ulp1 protease family, catalytic domain protein [Oesophagostomum dentatum]|uniref:Ulp1 protease family, catalytic domain protein n=1 Tax=Oesophagostomum dentatum TaxID=61180 RepID=A0A0B1SYW0_OESDE|nr:Ulp1 protease family, catalytic domain protein [Oesophagostomum dentatum]